MRQNQQDAIENTIWPCCNSYMYKSATNMFIKV